jgi:hypothetical protein
MAQQKEMKGAPVQMVRREDKLVIDAYVYFSGDAADAQKAYDAIINMWNTGNKTYNISGFTGKDFSRYAGNETLTLQTTIHGIGSDKKTYGEPVPPEQRTVTINLDKDSLLHTVLGLDSHVFTEDPKDLLYNYSPIPGALDILSGKDPFETALKGDKFKADVLANAAEGIATGELEKTLYNWTISNPGQMWLYHPEDAAHEFGHLLGLGDAYGAFYRQNKDAPPDFDATNLFGMKVSYPVSSNDIMRCGTAVTETDVALIAYITSKYGVPYYFDKQ